MTTKARIMKGRTGKITIATTVVLLLASTMLFVALTPTSAKRTTPETWRIRLPSGYDSSRQTFIKSFPELTASSFHYYNPSIAPSVSLSINLESVSAKTTDYVFYENCHVVAKGVDVSIGVPIPPFGDIRVARIVCREFVADVNLWPPREDGVFGTLTAKLRGEVLLSVPNVPGSTIPGYYYAGPELAIEWTFVEPRYTVIVDPAGFSIPQGCENKGAATVTVTPLDSEITGPYGFRFECRDMGGINGWIDANLLSVYVEPWVPTGTYTANVILSDWMTGREYKSNDIAVTVTESGFTIEVNDQDSPVDLGSIPRGSGQNCKITITPWTAYSGGGMPLYWRSTSGDFTGIGIDIPGGIPPPPYECGMKINVGPDVPLGVREMDICVFDSGLGKEFTCHVKFEIV